MDHDNHVNHAEDRQTAPMKAFCPSVLVTAQTDAHGTAPPTTNTAAPAPKDSTAGSHTSPVKPKHHPEDRQRSPLRAFAPTHAAGVSSSHQNSKENSPATSSLSLVPVETVGMGSGSAINGFGASGSALTPLEGIATDNVAEHSKQLKPMQVSKSPRGHPSH
eukprot:GDKK01064136.1.p1 GENE.GDKK01064136.1~~GDKK01064136.1.p1  ORF type:complete len:183 (+),score=10.92 GDKK01064136.1:65-550(+)